MNQITFEPGQYIFKEGDPSGVAYRIRTGLVLIQLTVEGRETTLGRLGPGEFLGETSLIDEHPRSASAVSLDHTVLDVVNETELYEMLENDSGLLHHYLESLYQRLRTTSALLRIEQRRNRGDGASMESALVLSELEFARSASDSGDGDDAGLPSFTVLIESHYAADDPDIRITADAFPFRIGRSRHEERIPPNTLLIDDREPFHVSRRHCCIEMRERHVVLTDLGSHLGTTVNGKQIGGRSQYLTAPLELGSNEVCLGAESSPHRFVLTVFEAD